MLLAVFIKCGGLYQTPPSGNLLDPCSGREIIVYELVLNIHDNLEKER